MRMKILTPLACMFASGVIVLPACGGGDSANTEPAAQSVPREQVEGVEQRVKTLEEETGKLRKELEAVRNTQSPGHGTGDDAKRGSDSTADGGGTSAGGGASGSGPIGGTDAGGGPDPGTTEDDPSIKDICGPNPAPEC